MKLTPFIAFLALMLTALAQDDPLQTGPTTLVIMYRCAPADRIKLRQQMVEGGLRRFDHWRQEGILSAYHVLFSRYVDSDSWDMLVLLTFRNYNAVTEWKRIERSAPAGFPPGELAIATAVNSYPTDRHRANAAPEAPALPVYLVLPYSHSVPPPAYLSYVDDYEKPQFDAWMAEGVLSSYEVLLPRYPAAHRWDSLIVLEYKDEASFAERDKVIAKVRASLQNNPTWKAASDNTQQVRTEQGAVIADELSLTR